MNGLKKPMTISVINENGISEEVDVVIAFEFRDNHKEYVVYTRHEVDDQKNVIVYVSNVDRTSRELPCLFGIDDANEWKRVKNVLRELADMDPSSGPDKFGDDGIELL